MQNLEERKWVGRNFLLKTTQKNNSFGNNSEKIARKRRFARRGARNREGESNNKDTYTPYKSDESA
jgi:hypothetical protein